MIMTMENCLTSHLLLEYTRTGQTKGKIIFNPASCKHYMLKERLFRKMNQLIYFHKSCPIYITSTK